MRRLKTFLVLIMTAAVAASAQSPDLSGRKVLIYTRNGEGYVHDNIEASVTALEELCKAHKINTLSTDDPAIFESEKLNDFDAIIFSNSNNEAFLKDVQRENFRKYIESGKGFMGVHSANASERDWPWYSQMIGGKFVRHPALQEFDIKIIDGSHPSTEHLGATWSWEDECYYSDHLNPAIRVLLAADLTTIDDPEKETFPGKIFGNLFPLAWYHTFHGTRVFYTALGHKIEYYQVNDFRKHLEGGILWILGED